MTRLPQKSVTAGATLVSGPRRRQRVMGRQVLEVLPIPPIALHLRTGIAMVSYATVSLFGVTADYDTTPDVDGIEDGVKRLAAVEPRTPAHAWTRNPRRLCQLVQHSPDTKTSAGTKAVRRVGEHRWNVPRLSTFNPRLRSRPDSRPGLLVAEPGLPSPRPLQRPWRAARCAVTTASFITRKCARRDTCTSPIFRASNPEARWGRSVDESAVELWRSPRTAVVR